MTYIRAANHVINLSNLSRCSKYKFHEDEEHCKWWIELSYIQDQVINLSFETEKEWLEAFDSVVEALCPN